MPFPQPTTIQIKPRFTANALFIGIIEVERTRIITYRVPEYHGFLAINNCYDSSYDREEGVELVSR